MNNENAQLAAREPFACLLVQLFIGWSAEDAKIAVRFD
jgi:hypothetical protein